MDFKKMTDGELAKLMLDVGDEMERRRGGRNLQARLTTVLEGAAVADIPLDGIDSAVESAKAKAQETVRRRTPEPEAPVVVPEPPTVAPAAVVGKAK